MKVLYVSYDGALDPLGASQVVPYLTGLARRGFELTLVSFEKPRAWGNRTARESLRRRLEASGIAWRPLRYHSRPRLPATLWDCLNGVRAIRSVVRSGPPGIVHCRGDLAMAMARWARMPPAVSLLYDMRGFYSDERVESGSWRRGSLVDRVVRRAERDNLRAASGMIVLTEAARDVLVQRHSSLPPLRVIPTCVDTQRFVPPPPGTEPQFGVAYCGSLGTWYMTKEMVDFAREAADYIPGRPLFLTPQGEEARAAGATPDWAEVRAVTPEEVPAWLQRCRALFFFIRPTPAKRASCPTKLAEGLATGLPVLANAGVGDLDRLLEPGVVGVLLRTFSMEGYRGALEQLRSLVLDPGTASRCRDLALLRYSVSVGVDSYASSYAAMIDQPASSCEL